MTKQILYSGFISRIFATNIDLLIIAAVLLPIMQLSRYKLSLVFFGKQLTQAGIDITNTEMVYIALNDPEFIQTLELYSALSLFASITIAQLVFIAVWLIFFWCKFGTSPGKFIMRLRVLDEETMEPLSLGQAITRVLGYVTAPVAVFYVFFTDKKQTLYDRWAKSVVIKA